MTEPYICDVAEFIRIVELALKMATYTVLGGCALILIAAIFGSWKS